MPTQSDRENQMMTDIASLKAWQDGHDRICTERMGNIKTMFGWIMAILGVGGTTVVAMLGWSLSHLYAMEPAREAAISQSLPAAHSELLK